MAQTAKSCYYQLRNIGQIRSSITEGASRTLVHALVMPSFLHLSLFVHFSLFVSLSLFLLLYFYETTLSSSPDPIHFILLYILRYYFCTRVIILYTCVCIPVLVVMSSIVYNLHHIMSSTLSFYFLRSSYRPAQSRNLCVVVILIMYLCQLFQLLHYG